MPPFPDFARRLRPDVAGTDDAELLRRFADQRDEAAFELLVWRHGGMVLAACRRVVGRSADADDAFQVTFLALARRAGAVRTAAALPGWLHRTARRAALRVKAATARHATRADLPEPAVEPAAPDDLGPVLDEEIDRLPEKLRRAFVLCHLEGVTNEAAAARLGCPKGTILSRLSRAREQLRDRLTRRGVVATALLAPMTVSTPSAAVAAATARAAAAFAAGPATDVPVHLVALTNGVLRTMRLARLRTAAAVVLACLAVGGGLALARPAPVQPPPPPAPVPAARPAPAPAAGPRALALDKHDSPQAGRLAFSPDGSILAVSGAKPVGMTVEDVLTLWDAATGKHLHTFRGDDAGGQGLAFAPDGTRLALPVTGAAEVVVRELPGGKELYRVPHPLVSGTEFSPDGKTLLTTSQGFAGNERVSDVRVWDAATGKKRFAVRRAKGEDFDLAWFRADGRLAIQTSAKALRVIDPATGKDDPPVRVEGGEVFFAGYSPDGKGLLALIDGRPRLLDAATGRVVREYGPAAEKYAHAAGSPQGTRVHGLTTTGRLRVWDAATGAEQGAYQAGPAVDSHARAAFDTPDGRYLLAHWTDTTTDPAAVTPWCAVLTPTGREVRKDRGVTYVEFDRAMRRVAVVTAAPDRRPDGSGGADAVTLHDAAAWLAGGGKD